MPRLLLLCFVIGSMISSFAEEPLLKAKVADVKEYKQGRIAYWEGNVPIFDGRPFFDLTLAVDGKKYLVRYESGTGFFPSAWKAGSEIPVKSGAEASS